MSQLQISWLRKSVSKQLYLLRSSCIIHSDALPEMSMHHPNCYLYIHRVKCNLFWAKHFKQLQWATLVQGWLFRSSSRWLSLLCRSYRPNSGDYQKTSRLSDFTLERDTENWTECSCLPQVGQEVKCELPMRTFCYWQSFCSHDQEGTTHQIWRVNLLSCPKYWAPPSCQQPF